MREIDTNIAYLPSTAKGFRDMFLDKYAVPLARSWLHLQSEVRCLGLPVYNDQNSTYSWAGHVMEVLLTDGSCGPAIVRMTGILAPENAQVAARIIDHLRALDTKDNVVPMPGAAIQLTNRLEALTIGYYLHVEPCNDVQNAQPYELSVVPPYDAPSVDELAAEFEYGDLQEVMSYYSRYAKESKLNYDQLSYMLSSLALYGT